MEPSTLEFVKVDSDGQIETVALLADRVWRECYSPILETGQIDYMLEKFQSPAAVKNQIQEQDYEYYLLQFNRQAAGYLAVQPKDGKLLLSKLYVLDGFRGNGLGARGLAYALQLAKEKNCTSVWLTVNRNNQRAIGVYEKNGFSVVREQVADIGGGYVMDDFIFEKKLT